MACAGRVARRAAGSFAFVPACWHGDGFGQVLPGGDVPVAEHLLESRISLAHVMQLADEGEVRDEGIGKAAVVSEAAGPCSYVVEVTFQADAVPGKGACLGLGLCDSLCGLLHLKAVHRRALPWIRQAVPGCD